MSKQWTESEIKSYKPEKGVESIYAQNGLSNASMEERSAFLVGYLKLTMTDHDVVMSIAAKEGRPRALNMLEQMAVQIKSCPNYF